MSDPTHSDGAVDEWSLASMDMTKLVGIATGIALAIALLYNVGYFMAADLGLFPLLSYKDHLSTLVLLVPTLIPATLVWFFLRRIPVVWFLADVAAFLIVSQLFGELFLNNSGFFSPLKTFAMYWSAHLLISYCMAIAIGLAPRSSDDASKANLMLASVLGVILFVPLCGYTRGLMEMGRKGTFITYDSQIVLKSENGAKAGTYQVHVVRAIDEGLLLLVQGAPRQLFYIRYDTIRTLAETLDP